MEQNWFYLIKQASEISKITLSVIVFAPCLNKTIINTNKKQMNSSADTFFWMTRYHREFIPDRSPSLNSNVTQEAFSTVKADYCCIHALFHRNACVLNRHTASVHLLYGMQLTSGSAGALPPEAPSSSLGLVSAPGHVVRMCSWHRLWTTHVQTVYENNQEMW